jgi:hypothetical protein
MRDMHLGSLEREEVEAAFSRYVLYLELTIVVLNIDYSPRDNTSLYVYVRISPEPKAIRSIALFLERNRVPI